MVRNPSPAHVGRRWARRLHLWLGLGLGGLFALLGLTGSALVFYTDIDAALHPALTRGAGGPAPDWRSDVWDRALATGRARRHDPLGQWTFEMTGKGGAIPARYYAVPNHHGDRSMIWFSPDGRYILRDVPWGGYVMSWIYRLHMELLAGAAGGQLVGWSGGVLLLLLATGVVAWWPRGSWTKALAFKPRAGPLRRLYDWHKLTGLGSATLLAVMAATGMVLALPIVAHTLFAPPALPTPRSSPNAGPRISMHHALAVAHRMMPSGRLVFVDIPNAGTGAIRARLQLPGDPQDRFPASYVWIDQYSGRVLAVRDDRHLGRGQTLLNWVRPLHDGSVGGLWTRVLTVGIGMTPTLLLVTGLLHWRRRRRPRRGGAS